MDAETVPFLSAAEGLLCRMFLLTFISLRVCGHFRVTACSISWSQVELLAERIGQIEMSNALCALNRVIETPIHRYLSSTH